MSGKTVQVYRYGYDRDMCDDQQIDNNARNRKIPKPVNGPIQHYLLKLIETKTG